MNLRLVNRTQIEALPGGSWIWQTISQLAASIGATWDQQHTDDGGHGTITATGSISERSRTTPIGEWIDIPFDADDFAGGGWTVTSADVFYLRYRLIGTSMQVQFNVRGKTTSDPGVSLTLSAPHGFRVPATDDSVTGMNACIVGIGTLLSPGLVQVANAIGTTLKPHLVLTFQFVSGDTWGSGSERTAIGQIEFEIVPEGQ